MKLINTLLAFSFLTVIASCSSSSRVRYDYDPEVNFASLKTYDWMKQPATSGAGVKAGACASEVCEYNGRAGPLSPRSQPNSPNFPGLTFLPPSIEIVFDMKNENGQIVQIVKRRDSGAQSQSKFGSD